MFAIEGAVTKEILSFRGKMVVHHDRREMEYLFPGQRVVMLSGYTIQECAHKYGRPAMWLKDHPDMASVKFPINPKEFL